MRDRTLSFSGPQAQAAETVYALYAVSVHFGGLGGGHYTAYARNTEDPDWNEYNDSSVSKVRDEDIDREVLTDSAYLLFYLRRDYWPRAWGGERDYDAEFADATQAAAAPTATQTATATGADASFCEL